MSELLIALAILGVIATFTIPKVLQSQQSSKYKSMAKEAAGLISEAYQAYKLKNSVTSSTASADLTPYINYVRRDTASTIDSHPSGGSVNCSDAWERCLVLHNGGVLRLSTDSFGGTGTTNLIYFDFDPDAKVTGNSSGEAVEFFLYYQGILTSRSNTKPNSYSSSGGPWGPSPAFDPPWFSWD